MKLAMRLSSSALKSTFFVSEALTESERATEESLVDALVEKTVACGASCVGAEVTTGSVFGSDDDRPVPLYGGTISGGYQKLIDFFSPAYPVKPDARNSDVAQPLTGKLDAEGAFPFGNAHINDGIGAIQGYNTAFLIRASQRGRTLDFPKPRYYSRLYRYSRGTAYFHGYNIGFGSQAKPQTRHYYESRSLNNGYETSYTRGDLVPKALIASDIKCVAFNDIGVTKSGDGAPQIESAIGANQHPANLVLRRVQAYLK